MIEAGELSQRLGSLSRELRKDRDVSQRALADAVGTAQAKVSLLEHGKLDFSALAFIARIADFHGLSPVELIGNVFEEVGVSDPRRRPDRPWQISAARVLARVAQSGDGLPFADAPRRDALARLPLDRLVTTLVRARAFGAAASAEPASWLLPFAPALMRRAIDELAELEHEPGLAPGIRESADSEIQRFALLHEMATRPREALLLAEELIATYALPELEYLRGVLLHRLGESPVRVKGAVHRALECLEREPPQDLRADLAISGLLEYLTVAAEAADRPDYYAALADDGRIEHALELLELAGFSPVGVHVAVRLAAGGHEALRAVPEADRDERWRARWEELRRRFEDARAEYEALSLPMGVAHAGDWLARHAELGGDLEGALGRIEEVAEAYRTLGRRRWLASAEVRAAYYRARLGEPDVDPERARGLAERTRQRIETLLDEGPVPPHERPMLEEHLARAYARLVSIRARAGAAASDLAPALEAYRRFKAAAIEHYDADVDSDERHLAAARESFARLEAADPILGGRE